MARTSASAIRLPETIGARAHDLLHGTPTGLVVLALTVGTGAGLGAVAFRYLSLRFTRLFSGHADYGAVGHAPHPGCDHRGRAVRRQEASRVGQCAGQVHEGVQEGNRRHPGSARFATLRWRRSGRPWCGTKT